MPGCFNAHLACRIGARIQTENSGLAFADYVGTATPEVAPSVFCCTTSRPKLRRRRCVQIRFVWNPLTTRRDRPLQLLPCRMPHPSHVRLPMNAAMSNLSLTRYSWSRPITKRNSLDSLEWRIAQFPTARSSASGQGLDCKAIFCSPCHACRALQPPVSMDHDMLSCADSDLSTWFWTAQGLPRAQYATRLPQAPHAILTGRTT